MKLRSKYKIYWRFGNMQMQIGFACFGRVFFACFRWPHYFLNSDFRFNGVICLLRHFVKAIFRNEGYTLKVCTLFWSLCTCIIVCLEHFAEFFLRVIPFQTTFLVGKNRKNCLLSVAKILFLFYFSDFVINEPFFLI